MDVIVEFAEGFIGLFKAGAETLVGDITTACGYYHSIKRLDGSDW